MQKILHSSFCILHLFVPRKVTVGFVSAEPVNSLAGFGLAEFFPREFFNIFRIGGELFLLFAKIFDGFFLQPGFLLQRRYLALLFLILPDFRQKCADDGDNHHHDEGGGGNPIERKPDVHVEQKSEIRGQNK